MRAALARLPAGTRRFEDALDDGTPLVVAITTRADGSATFDFTGSGPVHPRQPQRQSRHRGKRGHLLSALLAGRTHPAQRRSARARGNRSSRPGRCSTLPATLTPRRCPAVGGGNVETSQRLVDVILSARSALAAASQGTMNNLLFGRGGGRMAFGYYETIGGGAGADRGLHRRERRPRRT